MKSILVAVILFLLPVFVHAADMAASPEAKPDAAHAEKAEKELPLYAPPIGHIGPLVISNSMVVSWIVALGLIIFARCATKNLKEVPEGAQNFWEWLVESLYSFLEGIIGNQLVKKTFWFFATIFI